MIKNIKIYGERCSGTNFLEAIITGNSYFHHNHKPAFDLPTSKEYGDKHFFGFADEKIITKSKDTLFIAIVRHPYEWLSSLFLHKHHIPKCNHTLPNFLFNEWYSIDHVKESKNYNKEIHKDRNYENNKRYENIFELRTKKLNYLYYTMPFLAENYMIIRYEDLCTHQNDIIKKISKKFNIKIINENYIKANPNPPKYVLSEYETQIAYSLDWSIENKFHYNDMKPDILQFYKRYKVDENFDYKFYVNTDTSLYHYYYDFCQEHNISDEHRFFYHYSMYGRMEGRKPNIKEYIKDLPCPNEIIITNERQKIEDIAKPHKDFIDSFTQNTNKGKQIASNSKIAVVSLARQCENVLQNSIDSVLSLKCKDLKFFIYENDSTDNTKNILTKNKNNHEDILHIELNDLDRFDLRDRSKTRTNRLAKYRNRCLNWVKQNYSDFDYTLILDLDADLGFSIDGIYNSLLWLTKIKNAGGMGSYSLYLNKESYPPLAHYDSFAVRLNDWIESQEKDHQNIWFKHFHPLIGSPPIAFNSCFGGLAVYKTQAILSANYDGDMGSEHVFFHKNLADNGWDMYLNPSSIFFSVYKI